MSAEIMDTFCDTFFEDYFVDSTMEEYREKWVDDDHDQSADFGNWFMDKVEKELNDWVKAECADDNGDIWNIVVELDLRYAYRLYKKRYGKKSEDPTDAQLISCLFMDHIMENGHLQQWMELMEEAFMNEANEDESEANALFKNKHPNASCHRCDEKLNDHLYAVMCGGHGGACKTWYCASCHEDGTDDCGCESDESESDAEESESDAEESDDENDEVTWFNTKYPNASCHRCEEKLNGHTVVMCGGHGGACETWYCASCHEDGTDDCKCHLEEEDE